MTAVDFDPADLSDLYGGSLEDVFILVTSPAVRSAMRIANTRGIPMAEVGWLGHSSRLQLINLFQDLRAAGRFCCVLWLAEDEFEHFTAEELANVRLAAISFFSTPFARARLRRYLTLVRAADYASEANRERRLLNLLDEGRRIFFRSPAFGTTAVFQHQQALHWFSLNGPIGRGQQTVLPTGELSALTDPAGAFSIDTPFQLDGELLLYGQPIVHRGASDISVTDTDRTYRAISAMRREPVIARVDHGWITDVRVPEGGDNACARVLRQLFSLDHRYRKIHEIGFGTSATCDGLTDENFFPHERWPGVHFGLGLGGHTSFHIDLTCTALDVAVERAGTGTLVDIYDALDLRPARRLDLRPARRPDPVR